MKLGFVFPTMAEILAIWAGLKTNVFLGYEQVLVYTDSLQAIQTILTENTMTHLLRAEIAEIRELLYRGKEITLQYSPRVNLRCADFIAKATPQTQEGYRFLAEPISGCAHLIRADLMAARRLSQASSDV